MNHIRAWLLRQLSPHFMELSMRSGWVMVCRLGEDLEMVFHSENTRISSSAYFSGWILQLKFGGFSLISFNFPIFRTQMQQRLLDLLAIFELFLFATPLKPREFRWFNNPGRAQQSKHANFICPPLQIDGPKLFLINYDAYELHMCPK